MINFRFHLVSITAIFLALAAGIAIGAAVVDRASVDLLRSQLDDVEARREATNTRNDELKAELGEWTQFAEQAGPGALDGRLVRDGVARSVLLVAIDGVSPDAVTALETALTRAGANFQGTVWLSARWAQDDGPAADQLAAALELGGNLGADTVHRAATARLGRALLDGDPTDVLPKLQAAAFAEFRVAPGGPGLAEVPTADSTVVVVSGPGADVPDSVLALPLVRAMAGTGRGFIAAQPGAPAEGGSLLSYVGQIRDDRDLAARLTTVDSLDDFRGLVAAVIAVDVVATGGRGHFGLGRGAERVVPDTPSPAPAP